MGLLSPFLQQQQLLQQQPQLMMQPQQSPLAQLQPMAPQVRPSLGTRVNDMFNPGPDGTGGIFNSPLLQMGMSLLGNSRNGGDWGAVARDMQGITQQRQQQALLRRQTRRENTQDQREGQVFQRQQSDWQRQDQQYQRWENAVRAEQDPQRRAMLEAMGPQQYGEFMGQESQQSFQHNEGELDRAASLRNAQIAASASAAGRNDPRDRIQYQNDMRRLTVMGDAATYANTYALPKLQRAEQIIRRLSEIGGMDNPLSASRRIQLSQLGQFGTEARGLLQELTRIQTQFTVEDARALAPVSNTDFGRLMEINPNGNMTVDAAYRIVSGMRQDIQRGVGNYTAAARWADEHNGLTGTLDDQGRTFEQVQYENMQQSAAPQAPVASPAAPRTPQRGEVVDGYRFMGGNPADRRNWVRVNASSESLRLNNGNLR